VSLKPVVELDGAAFDDLEGFYDEVSRKLIPGAAWGRNLDAFNDILRGGFGTPPGGFIVRWKHSDLSRARLGHAETARVLRHRLTTCHPLNVSRVTTELEAATRKEGPTIFDVVVEILRDHEVGAAEGDDAVELILD
jgi:RNAse (barnase) inhibitor barstar